MIAHTIYELVSYGQWSLGLRCNTRGYTWGFMVEYREPNGHKIFECSRAQQANQMDLDMNLAQAHGDNLEFEVHYVLRTHPGAQDFWAM